MQFLKSSKGLFFLSFLTIILTNIFVFTNVYINKLGDVSSDIVLSQRELTSPYNYNKENSGISLRINYRIANKNTYQPYQYNIEIDWLNEKKLQELGFDTQKQKSYKNHKPTLKKEVFLVLEQNGEAYKHSLKLAQEKLDNIDNLKVKDIKRAKENLRKEKEKNSRLFVIDAGINFNKLRILYTDKKKYIIAKGVVKSTYRLNNIYGYIERLSISNIHVNLEHKNLLKNKNAKFKAHIKYGSRYEPWISEIN